MTLLACSKPPFQLQSPPQTTAKAAWRKKSSYKYRPFTVFRAAYKFLSLNRKAFFFPFFSKSGLEYVGGVKWAFLTKSRNDSSVTQRGQNVSAGFTLSNMWRPVGSLMPSLCLDFMWPNLPAVNKSFDSFLGTFFSHSESKKWVNDLLHVNKHGLIQETAEKS